MNSHDLAEMLEAVAKILRSMPNSSISSTLDSVLSSIEGGKKQSSKLEMSTGVDELPEGIEEKLKAMSLTEIDQFFSENEQIFTTNNLTRLAARLGITTSKRQSRNALVNLILRHIEAGQMDSMIRAARDVK
ncbi:hypothetical protein ABNQ39_13250 [Azospirillum sp. A26]|uniref:hypothetical protein n=1 Tax=Azospirillum sp. A26 TaxID=3160607 RepID=UPI00366C6925